MGARLQAPSRPFIPQAPQDRSDCAPRLLRLQWAVPRAGQEEAPVLTRKFSVAVLGAGHGGLALAGYLAQQGHRVSLWNRSPGRLAPVAALGGVRLGLPASATATLA